MTGNAAAGKETRKSKAIPILLAIQLVIAAATVVVTIVVGLKIRPLIERKEQLESEIEVRRADLAGLVAQIEGAKKQLEASKPDSASKILGRAIASVRDTTGIKARVYFHIDDESQRSRAREIELKLEKAGFVVPGIELRAGQCPKLTELRFFRKAESDEGRKIVAFLQSIGIQARLADLSERYEKARGIRPRHYELWFGRNEFK